MEFKDAILTARYRLDAMSEEDRRIELDEIKYSMTEDDGPYKGKDITQISEKTARFFWIYTMSRALQDMDALLGEHLET